MLGVLFGIGRIARMADRASRRSGYAATANPEPQLSAQEKRWISSVNGEKNGRRKVTWRQHVSAVIALVIFAGVVFGIVALAFHVLASFR